MRLLWLIDSLTLGGAESLVATFAEAARGTELELTVCALKTIDGNPIEKRLRPAGFDVVNLGARNLRDLGAFRRLVALIREREIDVVHSHLTYASIWGGLAAARARVPHVATLHTLPLQSQASASDRVRQRILARVLSHHAFRVVAVSQAQADAWVDAGLVDGEKVSVIPNAVDVEGAGDSPPAPHPAGGGIGRNAHSATVGTVAVLREGKGLDVLLRAFRDVRKAYDGAKLVIAGDGPLRAALEREANELGLGESVRWLGYRDDVQSVLASLDVFVHPTLRDALPTAVLEAMAAGVAVVASHAGGVPEIVEHESNGLLVEAGNEEALAAAIARLLNDENLRDRLAAAGRETVRERFGVGLWLERLSGTYRDAQAVRT
jgi:glycosyltransferase involved in cell wall biosynthesis